MGTAAILTTAAGRRTAILQAVRAIEPGAIASYGEIARRAGLPGRARLVGSVLRDETDPDLPWHRVTGAGGRIAVPAGSKAFREQVRRLRREGRQVEGGRVAIVPVAPESLDRLLWTGPD
ncbi:MAG TPA: MGMT family protein [Steroidobacteraceae bacterium]|nr:MGMT family protein [Steroidobacteraceae bacterium]HRX90529.1 MGMT family protein [Steroidobacteraceae bacterium]